MEQNNTKGFKLKNLFSTSKLNKYYLFPFLLPFLKLIAEFFINDIIENYSFNHIEFLYSMFICLSLVFGGFSHFIVLLNTKKSNIDNAEHMKSLKTKSYTSIKLIYNNELKKHKIKKFFLLFMISLIFTLSNILSKIIIIINKNSKKALFDSRIYTILFLFLFTKFILKNKIYVHQKLSIILIISGFIIKFILIFLKITEEDILINIGLFIDCIGFSTFIVMVKVITSKYYFSPYLCLLCVGIMSTIMTLIGFIGYSFIFNNNFLSYIIESIDFPQIEKKTHTYLYLCVSFIFFCIRQVFSFLIIYNFEPTILMVTEIFYPLFIWIVELIQKGNNILEFIINCLSYLILIIACLIYNEIIICNFFDLNKYTRKYIEERQRQDYLLEFPDSTNTNTNSNYNTITNTTNTLNNDAQNIISENSNLFED